MTGNARRGVLGGLEPDPDKGKPHKNVRRKCRLLMEGMSGDKYAAALRLLIDVRPEETLDALIAASEELVVPASRADVTQL